MTICSEAVVIGASAGALDALSSLLPQLPTTFPSGILVVVHLPADRNSQLVDLLQLRCKLPVREAEDKVFIDRGTVYLAPPDYHMLVERDYSISLSADEPVNYSRPSIDVLFESAADAFGLDLTGVILTGANNDGAAGLRAIEIAGGRLFVQRPDLAQAPQMPQAALEACRSAKALSLAEIAQHLCSGGAL